MMWTRCVQVGAPDPTRRLSTIHAQVEQRRSPTSSTGSASSNALMIKGKKTSSTYTQDQLIQQQEFFFLKTSIN